MEKLTALHKYLAEKNKFDENQLDSWAEKISLTPSGRNVTVGLEDMLGIEFAHVDYSAVFVIENYAGHAFTIFAQLSAFLAQFDDNREKYNLAEPEFDVDPQGIGGPVDIEIRIPFHEKLNLVLDEAGDVEVDGVRYRVDVPVIYEAEEMNLRPKNAQGGDV